MIEAIWNENRMGISAKDISDILKKLEPSLNIDTFTSPDYTLVLIALDDVKNYLNTHKPITNQRPKTELVAFLELWLQKWKKRIKIILKDEQRYTDLRHKEETLELATKNLRASELKDLEQIAIETLIAHGEICGTNILGKKIAREEIHNYFESRKTHFLPTNPKERILILTTIGSNIARKSKLISKVHGHLIFVRPDRKYFVREWRNWGMAM